jgi:hypothetical protein
VLLLPKPPEDQGTCFICGRQATTKEHVIPKWLQHRFNLWNQVLTIPNRTQVPYRSLKVPACLKCNSEVYGQLEQRVANGLARDADIWRWANKIHYALGYKDRFFDWDRRNPGAKIGDVIRPDDPIERDRHFLHCVSGDFAVQPDPFGSVFRFDFHKEQDFTFAHLISTNSICVSLGRTGYVVFVTDGQALRQDRATGESYREFCPRGRKEDMHFFYARCVEHITRHQLGQTIVMSAGFIARLGPTVVHDVEPPNPARFRALCSHLGLEWINSRPDSLEEARETILSVLRQRGLAVSDTFADRLSRCSDIQLLIRWIDKLPDASSADELLGLDANPRSIG